MTLPSSHDLQEAWKKLQKIHKEHLSKHGVSIPKAEYYAENNKATWLATLWYFEGKEVNKNTISQIVARDIDGAAPDQQVRHLKRDGWEIGPKHGVHKLDPFNPSQEFVTESARKRTRLGAGTFEDIKKSFGYRCATCGAQDGEPDSRYGGGRKVHLQQGHQDPHKDGDDRGNIIPQCQFCNQSYKSDFVFDDKGRVRAVADIAPVKRASITVQKRIWEWLNEKFGSK